MVKWFGQVNTPKGPQHRLQTANQGVQYIRGAPRVSTLGLVPRTYPYWARLRHRCTVRPMTVRVTAGGVFAAAGGVFAAAGGVFAAAGGVVTAAGGERVAVSCEAHEHRVRGSGGQTNIQLGCNTYKGELYRAVGAAYSSKSKAEKQGQMGTLDGKWTFLLRTRAFERETRGRGLGSALRCWSAVRTKVRIIKEKWPSE
eukprot:8018648-Pyramimonas_sp.AAC.1